MQPINQLSQFSSHHRCPVLTTSSNSITVSLIPVSPIPVSPHLNILIAHIRTFNRVNKHSTQIYFSFFNHNTMSELASVIIQSTVPTFPGSASCLVVRNLKSATQRSGNLICSVSVHLIANLEIFNGGHSIILY